MKKILIPFIVGMAVSCAHPSLRAQEFKETISRKFTLQKEAIAGTLAIYNINGSIKVEGYAGNEVVCKVDMTISAKNSTDLETGKKEFKPEFIQNEDSIIAYIAEPFDTRPHRSQNRHGQNRQVNYDFKLDFVVKVPYNMNLDISTINEGAIVVENVNGKLNVHHVNGAVTLNNAKGTTNAGTVNGDVTVTYLSNPSGNSSYNTINGDINVEYRSDLSADMQFKSMHGEFYTDFPNVEVLPAVTIKNKMKEGDGTVYKLNKTTAIRIGSGGKVFEFETLNGNVYIKKQS
jgi:DUF4097 and DUF4098 domain-containing protein YvlB